MDDSIREFIKTEIAEQLAARMAELAEGLKAELVEELAARTDGLAASARGDLVLATPGAGAGARELALVGQQICDSVYEQVITEINEQIVPKVNDLVEYVNYRLQDGNEVVDSYRRAVEHRCVGTKLITDGVDDSRIISEHVRLFFGSDD
jgi:hypothetical protein